MAAATRPIADRLAEAGLPYHLTRPTHFWAVFTDDSLPVIAFTDEGVYVGYHSDLASATELAKKVRRMHGVERVVVVTETVNL